MPMMTRLRSGRGQRKNYRSMAGLAARPRAAARLSKPVRTAVARVAKAAIKVETKHTSMEVVDANFNSSITSASECYPVIPVIPLGDADWQRTGSRISNGYLYIKGTIQLTNAATEIKPLTARLFVLEQKNQKDTGSIASRTQVGTLLDPRIGTDVGTSYTGSFPSNQSPVNKELFKVYYDKQFKFNWDYTGNLATAGAATGNNLTKSFSIRVKLPKTLLYDSAATLPNTPTNSAPFLCLGYQYDDGTAADYINVALKCRALSTIYFKDA